MGSLEPPSPLSPDLAPNLGYKHLSGTRCSSNSVVKPAAESWLNGQRRDFCQAGLNKLVLRSDKCLNSFELNQNSSKQKSKPSVHRNLQAKCNRITRVYTLLMVMGRVPRNNVKLNVRLNLTKMVRALRNNTKMRVIRKLRELASHVNDFLRLDSAPIQYVELNALRKLYEPTASPLKDFPSISTRLIQVLMGTAPKI
ncbi:hypothetical protein AVEN_203151-1 [Araneus ventricosus]|uniref:Uncharacterized protein n=1 Tax=Araneus ventricosus TaxID=182803 RepID=A0A4Y2CHA4_ARAVE|nr:hypothetical protein AVEN_203151-1 [Araneus ventricosus]